jgi:hypothetical protein
MKNRSHSGEGTNGGGGKEGSKEMNMVDVISI